MAVIITLVLGTLGARLVGWLGVDYVDSWPQAIAVGLAAMFVMTGVAHFVDPAAPGHDRDRAAAAARSRDCWSRSPACSNCSAPPGCCIRPPGSAAAMCLFVLMLVMFPANVYASRMPNPPKSMTTRLPLRTVEQIVFVGAALVVGLGGIQ